MTACKGRKHVIFGAPSEEKTMEWLAFGTHIREDNLLPRCPLNWSLSTPGGRCPRRLLLGRSKAQDSLTHPFLRASSSFAICHAISH